jgi:hypothetical protein
MALIINNIIFSSVIYNRVGNVGVVSVCVTWSLVNYGCLELGWITVILTELKSRDAGVTGRR